MRRHLVFKIVGHRIADGARAVAHRCPAHDRQNDTADAEQPGFPPGDEIFDEGKAEGRHGAEHRVTQCSPDAGHVTCHRADRDGPADAECRRRSDRHCDQETDGCALDRDRDGVEGETWDVHRFTTVSRP